MNFLSVELSTNRLLLRPISFKYKADIFTEFTEKITIYMHPCPPKNISETEAFINDSITNMKSGNNLIFVILKKTTEEFLGCAGIHGIEQKEPELGI